MNQSEYFKKILKEAYTNNQITKEAYEELTKKVDENELNNENSPEAKAIEEQLKISEELLNCTHDDYEYLKQDPNINEYVNYLEEMGLSQKAILNYVGNNGNETIIALAKSNANSNIPGISQEIKELPLTIDMLRNDLEMRDYVDYLKNVVKNSDEDIISLFRKGKDELIKNAINVSQIRGEQIAITAKAFEEITKDVEIKKYVSYLMSTGNQNYSKDNITKLFNEKGKKELIAIAKQVSQIRGEKIKGINIVKKESEKISDKTHEKEVTPETTPEPKKTNRTNPTPETTPEPIGIIDDLYHIPTPDPTPEPKKTDKTNPTPEPTPKPDEKDDQEETKENKAKPKYDDQNITAFNTHVNVWQSFKDQINALDDKEAKPVNEEEQANADDAESHEEEIKELAEIKGETPMTEPEPAKAPTKIKYMDKLKEKINNSKIVTKIKESIQKFKEKKQQKEINNNNELQNQLAEVGQEVAQIKAAAPAEGPVRGGR